jgi:transposase InsO family protein
VAGRYIPVSYPWSRQVYVTGFTDNCSRYRVKSKVYLHKDAASAVNALQWALRAGRIPREIYLNNGKQFVSKVFKAEAQKNGIKLIFGRPYNPRGRDKIERYHKTLYQELIALKEFHSVSHFKRELWNFRPPIQQLAKAGDPELDDSDLGLSQRN